MEALIRKREVMKERERDGKKKTLVAAAVKKRLCFELSVSLSLYSECNCIYMEIACMRCGSGILDCQGGAYKGKMLLEVQLAVQSQH